MKSHGSWPGGKGSTPRGSASSYCIKACKNRDKFCVPCWRFDHFEPIEVHEQKDEK